MRSTFGRATQTLKKPSSSLAAAAILMAVLVVACAEATEGLADYQRDLLIDQRACEDFTETSLEDFPAQFGLVDLAWTFDVDNRWVLDDNTDVFLDFLPTYDGDPDSDQVYDALAELDAISLGLLERMLSELNQVEIKTEAALNEAVWAALDIYQRCMDGEFGVTNRIWMTSPWTLTP